MVNGAEVRNDEAGDGMAGRLILAIDAAVPAAVQQSCATLATALADQTGMPVTVAAVPLADLDLVRASLSRNTEARRREYTPRARPDSATAMSSAPFVWRSDGRPDWASMWTTFCELALYGGPPQRGPANALRAAGEAVAEADGEMLAEMRRGIWETTGLYAEAGPAGWLAVTCDSPTMAAWMCATIILENVGARVEDDRLLVPAGPGYRLTDEVKSIITVVAKTHHYWQAHITGAGDEA
jgi:hypothetical protein